MPGGGMDGREGDDRFLRKQDVGKGNEGRTLVSPFTKGDIYFSSEPVCREREIQRERARARAGCKGGLAEMEISLRRHIESRSNRQDKRRRSCVWAFVGRP